MSLAAELFLIMEDISKIINMADHLNCLRLSRIFF